MDRRIPFDLVAFIASSLDWLLAHPLVQAALLGAAAVVVWKLGSAIRREGRYRAVRRDMLQEEIVKASAVSLDSPKRFR